MQVLRTQNSATAPPVLRTKSPPILRIKLPRVVHKPVYLQDYVCNHSAQQHWCNIIDYHALSVVHHQIAQVYEIHTEPQNYDEASQDPNWI